MGEKLCFGLPGNPCSAHVTFTLLVRPALLMLRGLPQARAQLPVRARVRLATDTHWERLRERRFVRSLRAEVLEAKLLDDVQSDPVRPEFARAVVFWDQRQQSLVARSRRARGATANGW